MNTNHSLSQDHDLVCRVPFASSVFNSEVYMNIVIVLFVAQQKQSYSLTCLADAHLPDDVATDSGSHKFGKHAPERSVDEA